MLGDPREPEGGRADQEERFVMAAKEATSVDPLAPVSALIDTGNVDTV
jgi:hypothetical protein